MLSVKEFGGQNKMFNKGILGNELADALATNNKKKLDDLIYKYDIVFLYIFNEEG